MTANHVEKFSSGPDLCVDTEVNESFAEYTARCCGIRLDDFCVQTPIVNSGTGVAPVCLDRAQAIRRANADYAAAFNAAFGCGGQRFRPEGR